MIFKQTFGKKDEFTFEALFPNTTSACDRGSGRHWLGFQRLNIVMTVARGFDGEGKARERVLAKGSWPHCHVLIG
jgi:hypothetical protein